MSGGLSSIATGLLRVFRKGGNPPPPVSQPAAVQQPVQLPPVLPPVQPPVLPPVTEAEYETALAEAMPKIDAVRAFGQVNATGRKAIKAMDDALNTAAVQSDDDDFDGAAVALKAALAQAQIITDERGKMRAAFLDQQAKLDAQLVIMRSRIGKLASPPAAITAALKAATDAQATAKQAGAAKPEDWPDAGIAIKEYAAALGGVNAPCLAEAGKKMAAFAVRFGALKDTPPAGAASIKARVAYLAQQNKLAGLIAAKDGLGAMEAAPAVDAALVDYEGKAAPSDRGKSRVAAAALRDVMALSDDDLATKSLAEKAALAFDLCANDRPSTDPALAQLCRLYRKCPPDPLFLAERDKERSKIAEKVAAITDLNKLFDKKGKIQRREWDKIIADPVKAQALLKQVSDAQAEVLGLPPIVITTYSTPSAADGTTDMGGCVWTEDGPPTIQLNAHRDALGAPDQALISILHETYHAQQDILVKRLMAGELGPDDPMYPQVLMFAANKPGYGYLPPAVSQPDYEAQPVEIDAEIQGTATTNAVMLALRGKGKKK